MTSQKVRPFLQEMSDYCTLEGTIDYVEAFLSYKVRTNLTDTTTMPFNLLVKVRSRSGQ